MTGRERVEAALDQHGWTVTTEAGTFLLEAEKGTRRVRVVFDVYGRVTGGNRHYSGGQDRNLGSRDRARKAVAFIEGLTYQASVDSDNARDRV